MKYIFIITTIAIGAALPAYAYTYVPLSSGLPIQFSNDLPAFINDLVAVSVAIAAVLAVIMVAVGGFQYMTTDSVFAMGDAKSRISGAITGLLIVLAAILILETINPSLVQINLFKPIANPNQAP